VAKISYAGEGGGGALIEEGLAIETDQLDDEWHRNVLAMAQKRTDNGTLGLAWG
jgi:hypothetical protein